jgi:lambda family phage tail tape measure protein
VSVVANVAINLDARGANQQLQQFQQRSTAAGRAAEQLQTSTESAGQAAQIVGRTFETAANKQKYYIDAAGRARRENGQLVTSTEAVTAGLRRQSQAAEAASKGLGGLVGSIRGLAAAYTGIEGFRFIFAKTAELQTQQRSLQVLTGSLGQANDIIKELQEYGSVTPFTSSELIESAKRLKAYSIETDSLVKVTKQLGDVAGATGANLGELAVIYGQVASKGRLQTEELMQFAERGINLQQELQRMYGLSGEEFRKALEGGKISAEAVQVAFENLTKTGGTYANGAVAQSDTLSGRLSTLTDNIESVAREIGKVLSPAILSALETANATLGEMPKLVSDIALAFQYVAQKLAPVINGLGQMQFYFKNLTPPGWAMQLINFAGGNFRGMVEEGARRQRLSTDYVSPFAGARDANLARLRQMEQGPSRVPPLLGGTKPGGGGGGAVAAAAKKAATGKTDAQREAERAAEQERQIQDRLRGINLETAGMKQLGILKDLQLQAEIDGNKEQQIQLQLEERLLNIRQRLAQSLLGESNERIRVAMLTQAQEESAAAQVATAGELIKLEAERKKSFDDITRGMQDQIDLAGPLTEQQRRSLEFEKQIAQWKRDGAIKTEDEISTLRRLNKELEERQKLTSAQRVTVALNETKMQLGELTNVGNMAITSANAIGDAFGQAFKSIASGSASTKEVLADFFQSVSNAFLDMAAQIIAKQITMLILQTALKALGATGGVGAPGGEAFGVSPEGGGLWGGMSLGEMPALGTFAKGGVFTPDGPLHAFAKGGVVTAPTEFNFADGGALRRGLMGEAGAEAIMPLKRTADGSLGIEATIPFQRSADDTTEPTIPFQRSADGGPSRSNPFAALSAASIPFTKSTERLMVERSDRETIAAINNPKPLEVRFESQVINGVEYVTAEQHRKGMAEAADRGRKLTLAELRNSVKTRKMMGLS